MLLIAFSALLLLPNQLFAQSKLSHYFERIAVTGLCESGQYFYECFDRQNDCQIRMRSFVKICLDENLLIIKNNSKSNELEMITPVVSFRMGLCLGEKFEKKFLVDKKSNPKCYQSDHWITNE